MVFHDRIEAKLSIVHVAGDGENLVRSRLRHLIVIDDLSIISGRSHRVADTIGSVYPWDKRSNSTR